MAAPEFEICSLLPWIEERFTRSPGPGGQNVNKLNTRVTLLFDFSSCGVLTDRQRIQIRARLRTRLSRDGRLRVVCSSERTQAGNRTAAQSRLLELLQGATKVTKPRRATRPTLASKERRLGEKRRRAETRRTRGSRTSISDS